MYILLFLASTPIALMPAAIALMTKSRQVVPIVSVNLLVYAGICLFVRGPVFGLSAPSLIGLLIPWLVLLRFAIHNEGPR